MLDGIAVGEGSFQSFEGVGHRWVRCDLGYDRARFGPRITADEVRRLADPLPYPRRDTREPSVEARPRMITD